MNLASFIYWTLLINSLKVEIGVELVCSKRVSF